MTDRRSGPPLFDLMRDRGDRAQNPDTKSASKPTQPSNPAPQPAPRPAPAAGEQTQTSAAASSGARQTAWDSTGGVSRAERSAAAMLDEPVSTDSGVTLSVPKFYTLIALALVLIVGAWAGGYQIGQRDGKDEMSRFMTDQPVVSPSGTDARTNELTNEPQTQPRTQGNPAGTTSPQQQTGTTGPAATQQPRSQPATGATRSAGAIMTPSGYLTQDPRIAGMNYLVLATLPTEQASDAIGFMETNGLTIIGVPQLDSGGTSANNPSRYTLYSLGVAIPGNQWSAMSSQRRDHQQMIADLGAKWQRERRGGSDFSQTNWEKYEP